jgi:hypothetical protein
MEELQGMARLEAELALRKVRFLNKELKKDDRPTIRPWLLKSAMLYRAVSAPEGWNLPVRPRQTAPWTLELNPM